MGKNSYKNKMQLQKEALPCVECAVNLSEVSPRGIYCTECRERKATELKTKLGNKYENYIL